MAPLFLWLNKANQACAMRGVSQSVKRWLTSDECSYPYIKKVRIETTAGEYLHMFEIQALSSDNLNVALNKTASQSSTLNTKFASLAIDGDATTFSHTALGDSDASWELDLGSTYSLKLVKIQNRWCADPSDPNGCLCRLSGATMSLLDDQDLVVATKTFGNTCGLLDVNVDLSTCSQPSSDEIAGSSITHTDAVIVGDDSFWMTFHNPLEDTEIFTAVVSNSHCTDDNSSFEVDSNTPNVEFGSSNATVSQNIKNLITPDDRNQGSVYLSFCLRADVRATGHAPSLLSSKVSIGITTLDFSDTVINYQSEVDLNIHAAIGECVSPGNQGPFAIGSTLKFCVKSMDTGVVISKLSDVYFTDIDGNPILNIIDASGEASFVTTIAGLESNAVYVATMMTTTIYDQGYGGTTINVQGTVSVTYIDPESRRKLKAVEKKQPFTVKLVVADTTALEDYSKSASETNKNKAIGANQKWHSATLQDDIIKLSRIKFVQQRSLSQSP
eukprot:scaffold2614_cov85-Cyclotella_meneghiniana.AAC.2